MINSKTREELLHENASLKDNLDDLTRRYHALSRDRQHDRDTLKGSVAMLQKDLRRQAERVMAQSTATLAETRRQLPPLSAVPPTRTVSAAEASALHAAQQRLAELGDELRAAKAEAEKAVCYVLVTPGVIADCSLQNMQAQRYKSRYDDLRKAIMDKRKAKDAAQAAAAAAANSSDGQPATHAAAAVASSNGKDATDNG